MYHLSRKYLSANDKELSPMEKNKLQPIWED